MRYYVAFLDPEDDGSAYNVTFPDLPGCISCGDTVDEAVSMATEALALHLEGMQADGDAIPDPTPLERVARAPELAQAVAVLIPAPGMAKPKPVRLSITMREDILRRVDAAAEAEGMTRSGFLAAAAQDFIRRQSV